MFGRLPSDAVEASVDRKLAARRMLASDLDRKVVTEARERYVAKLRAVRFGAIVADFDGTVMPPGAGKGATLPVSVVRWLETVLRHKVALYFATGRGDSVYHILRDSLPARYYPGIHGPITTAG